MTFAVRSSGDAATAAEAAGPFLEANPVQNNLLLSLLAQRVALPEEGRYWWVAEGGRVLGFALQSPTRFRAVLAQAPTDAVEALVEHMAGEAPGVPGVMGEAATAASFAGHWAERRRTPAAPVEGQRLYRLGTLRPPGPVPGRLRQAGPGDRDMVVGWMTDFIAGTGGHPLAPGEIVDRHMAAGGLWLWDHDGPVSATVASRPIAGVARVAFVYTPPEHRRRGYAAACVAAVSRQVVDAGWECVLYTQLQNPTSNGVYRRIGYEPVVEALIYRFG